MSAKNPGDNKWCTIFCVSWRKGITSLGIPYKYQPQEAKMELRKILPDLVKEVVKQTLESIMTAEREVFLKENGETKNGFYVRNLDTAIGKLKNLKIPRDREGRFKTKLIEPYKRRDINLEDLILGMFASGMSARAVAQALESVFELKYSPSTISKISQVTLEEINKWKQRKLRRRYSVIMLDGMWLSVRRGTVEKEAVLFALGIDEEGYREILDFEDNPWLKGSSPFCSR